MISNIHCVLRRKFLFIFYTLYLCVLFFCDNSKSILGLQFGTVLTKRVLNICFKLFTIFSRLYLFCFCSVMVFIRSERSGRSRPSLQKCRKAAPPKKCRKASTTVVLNQGSTKSFQGFGGRYPIF